MRRGTFEGAMLGHGRTCLVVDILKATHKAQHAAMLPFARHHYCGHFVTVA